LPRWRRRAARFHHIAGGEGLEHFEKLAPVAVRAGDLLSIDVPVGASGGAELLKLGVERLAVGADASIADEADGGSISVISYGNSNPLKKVKDKRECPKS
jgi:hypothetical protein